MGLRTLLDLSEQVIDQEDGYWVKIEAWEVERSFAVAAMADDGCHSITRIATRPIQESLMSSRMRISCCQISSSKSTLF